MEIGNFIASIIGGLLSVVAFFLVRLINSMDKLTKTVEKMQVEGGKNGVKINVLEKRTDKLESEVDKLWQKSV